MRSIFNIHQIPVILNRTLVSLIISMVLCFSLTKAYGQGCSDAGFCTMGAMKPNQHFAHRMDTKLKSVEFTAYAGYTKFHDLITTYIADFNFALGKRYAFQVKLPYTFVNGKLANTNGVGDISLALTRSLITKEKYQVGVTIGTKIPTNNSNFKEAGRSLPMYYQSSLGTYDIIAGASLITKKWLFAAGYQQALNVNGNQFKWSDWAGLGGTESVALKYPVSNKLLRGNDVMLRAERNFRFARFNYFTGLLGIYRLNRDLVTFKGVRGKVPGSEGLAMTFLNGVGYRFSARSSVKLLVGFVIVRRDTNPDGLSRDYVASVSYQFRF
jgi:hypothetical protein